MTKIDSATPPTYLTCSEWLWGGGDDGQLLIYKIMCSWRTFFFSVNSRTREAREQWTIVVAWQFTTLQLTNMTPLPCMYLYLIKARNSASFCYADQDEWLCVLGYTHRRERSRPKRKLFVFTASSWFAVTVFFYFHLRALVGIKGFLSESGDFFISLICQRPAANWESKVLGCICGWEFCAKKYFNPLVIDGEEEVVTISHSIRTFSSVFCAVAERNGNSGWA